MRPKCIEIMITTYYIKTNPVFWLATREGKMAYVARVGLPVLILRKKDSSGWKQLN